MPAWYLFGPLLTGNVSRRGKMTQRPTFDEFRQCVFKEYDVIISSYSFVEHPLPERKFINNFQVRLANATTLIIIEGINYGMASWTRVCKFPQPFEKDDDLPIWRYISERKGGSWPPKRKSKKKKELGQLVQIKEQAKDLLEYASDVLRGDFSAIDNLIEKEKIEAEERKLNAPSPARRAANVAASEAGHALKKKEYQKVVKLLKPHLHLLPESQRKRYLLAKKYIRDSG